jgi:hypothetical protein
MDANILRRSVGAVSFREKLAWLSFIANALVFGAYFLTVAGRFLDGTLHGAELIGLFVAAAALLTIIHVSAAIMLALSSLRGANARADDREQLIELKSGRIGGYVLAVGVMIVALGAPLIGYLTAAMPATDPSFAAAMLMANGILFALVMGELADALSQIVRYRMDA